MRNTNTVFTDLYSAFITNSIPKGALISVNKNYDKKKADEGTYVEMDVFYFTSGYSEKNTSFLIMPQGIYSSFDRSIYRGR